MGGRNKAWQCYLRSLKIVWRAQEGIWFRVVVFFLVGVKLVCEWVWGSGSGGATWFRDGWMDGCCDGDTVAVIVFLMITVNHITLPTWALSTVGDDTSRIFYDLKNNITNPARQQQSHDCDGIPSCLCTEYKKWQTFRCVSAQTWGENHLKSYLSISPLISETQTAVRPLSLRLFTSQPASQGSSLGLHNHIKKPKPDPA